MKLVKTLILKKNCPLLRFILAIFLSIAAAYLLPTNQDKVLHQQILREIPRLADGFSNGPWTFIGIDHSICLAAFSDAQKQRTTLIGNGPTISYTYHVEDKSFLLIATILTPETRRQQRTTRIKKINGWSLFPPLLAVLTATLSGWLISGLSLAILAGGLISIYGTVPIAEVPLATLHRTFIDYLWIPLTNSFQFYILGFTVSLLGLVRVTSLSGGNQGIAKILASRANGARSTRLAAFLMGLAIFFDDYANTIVVGTTLRPMTDRFRVSREKLAYIVDSTAAPIAGIALISTWIGYEISLFEDLMNDLDTGLSGYQLFFMALPSRFYCIFTLFFVALSSWFQRDYGPMLRAERRANTTGQVLRSGSVPLTRNWDNDVSSVKGITPAWWTAALPIVTIVVGVVIGMMIDTFEIQEVAKVRLKETIFSLNYWTTCFSNANSARVLFHASLLGSALAIFLAISRRNSDTGALAISPIKVLSTWAKSITGIYYALAILILAWAMKEVCSDVGTSTYLTSVLSPISSPSLLPVLIFGLASLVAFSIGTSWATMAILIPTVVPLAHAMGGLSLTILSAAAVLDGAIFGDHCSPTSDTTVMSSIASSCDHRDHVLTQLPYALTTMSVAATFGYLGSSLLYSNWTGLGLGLGAILIIILVVGKNPDEYKLP